MEYQLKASAYTLSKKQINSLIDNTRYFRDRVILKILAGTGIRRSEVAQLRISDIDFNERTMRIEGKGNKVRMVPYSLGVRNDILQWLDGRNTGFVFPSRIVRGRGLIEKRINEICAHSGRRANITNPNPKRKYINPHIFRHSFARVMKDQGMSFETLQNILGHASFLTTVDTYGTKSLADIKHDFDQAVFI